VNDSVHTYTAEEEVHTKYNILIWSGRGGGRGGVGENLV